ncbi:hypothetical protein HPB50_009547 [Hyalomma asiaticum]|uniref:Uncharacterized protein n=1 Tax=Hyalomma asiaticum TaxID=266040 RepID=A0ACB7T5F9_HYAAI|nr:hypothetical protein HPB50_009547 [Hyalomma asiaticum]
MHEQRLQIRYLRHQRLSYAQEDETSASCFQDNPTLTPLKEAYDTLNNTLIEECNYGTVDSLLLTKRIDFVGRSLKCSDSCFFNDYAVLPHHSICFMVRQSAQLSPSFANTWFTFFAVASILAPFAALLVVVLRARGPSNSGTANSVSSVVMVFLSAYLGRSPPENLRLESASMKIAFASWMIGMTLLLQFTQTHITASQSVPEHTFVIRHGEDLGVALDAGAIRPCMFFPLRRGLPRLAVNVPHLQSMERAMVRCGLDCLVESLHECVPKAHRGTHAIVGSCHVFAEDRRFAEGLVHSADELSSFYFASAIHGNAPFRGRHTSSTCDPGKLSRKAHENVKGSNTTALAAIAKNNERDDTFKGVLLGNLRSWAVTDSSCRCYKVVFDGWSERTFVTNRLSRHLKLKSLGLGLPQLSALLETSLGTHPENFGSSRFASEVSNPT